MIEACLLLFGWSAGIVTMYFVTRRANEKFRQDLIVATAHLVKQTARELHVGNTGPEIHRPQDER